VIFTDTKTSVADSGWIRIQEGKNNPQSDKNKIKKLRIHVSGAEGFSCSLDVLYGGYTFEFE
jgi:hypothetical protein